MISSAFVYVYCDGTGCRVEEEFELLKVQGGYEEPEIEERLSDLDWLTINETTHLCPECVYHHKRDKQ